jgi:hypothetical protein
MITLSRYSFFQDPGHQTLRFSEHSPGHEEGDHAVCNCTRNVTEKPEGDPTHVSQDVSFTREINGRQVEYRLTGQAIYLDAKKCEPGSRRLISFDDDHAAFDFHRPNTLNVYVPVPGHRLGMFHAYLFLGNQIDISTLMNGHSPSRVVKLDKIGAEDLWLHECFWGHEGVTLFDQHSAETASWRALIRMAQDIHQRSAKLRTDLTTDVHVLRAAFESDQALCQDVYGLMDRVAVIRENIKQMEVFPLATQLYDSVVAQDGPAKL